MTTAPTIESVPSALPAGSGLRGANIIVLIIALVHVAAHALTNGNYGIFRDELYYIDCARHPAIGYVDHPPLSIWLLVGTRFLFGDSVHAIRLLSQLAGAALVVVAARIAKEMGGGRFALIAAAMATAVAPALTIETGFYSMNAFDLLAWAIMAWIIVRIVNTGDARWWLWFGVVAGLGMLNKISPLFLGFGVVLAIPFTLLRKHFLRWEIYAGGAIAAALFLPYVLWNASHDWPTLEFMDNAKRYKIAALSPGEFLGEQLMGMSPFLAPIWIAGLIWLLASRRGGRYRIIGLAYLVVVALLIAQRAKAYYVFPAYTMLFAGGACAIESVTARPPLVWARALVFIVLGVSAAFTAPLAYPIFSPETFVEYQAAIGVKQKPAERHGDAELPQYFADRFGWENMTRTVASVYESLTDGEKERCLILGSNYGETGAINYFGPHFGLPQAFSVHNNHYYWGPPAFEPEVVIYIGGSREGLESVFEEVQEAAKVVSKYAMPFETNLSVYICRKAKIPIREAWRAHKKFI